MTGLGIATATFMISSIACETKGFSKGLIGSFFTVHLWAHMQHVCSRRRHPEQPSLLLVRRQHLIAPLRVGRRDIGKFGDVILTIDTGTRRICWPMQIRFICFTIRSLRWTQCMPLSFGARILSSLDADSRGTGSLPLCRAWGY